LILLVASGVFMDKQDDTDVSTSEPIWRVLVIWAFPKDL
jgi:hypothetical protein